MSEEIEGITLSTSYGRPLVEADRSCNGDTPRSQAGSRAATQPVLPIQRTNCEGRSVEMIERGMICYDNC